MIDAKISWTDDANALSALLWISEMKRSLGADRVSVEAVVRIDDGKDCNDAQLQRMHDRLLAQIIRINDWCAEHAPDEYHSEGDTADAIIAAGDTLRGTVTRLSGVIERQNDEIFALRQQLAQMDADNARLTDELRTVRSWSVAPQVDEIEVPA